MECAGPHPALRRVLAVDAAAALAIMAEGLAGWDALASDLATAAALGPAPGGAQACSATQVRPLLLHPVTQSSRCPGSSVDCDNLLDLPQFAVPLFTPHLVFVLHHVITAPIADLRRFASTHLFGLKFLNSL